MVNYTGTGSANIFVGGPDDDLIEGLGGDDTLSGEGGNDEIYGGADNDELFGGDDDDLLYGGTGDDELFGGTGYNALYGGAGFDTLQGGTLGDGLYGGLGGDIIRAGEISDGDGGFRPDLGFDQVFGTLAELNGDLIEQFAGSRSFATLAGPEDRLIINELVDPEDIGGIFDLTAQTLSLDIDADNDGVRDAFFTFTGFTSSGMIIEQTATDTRIIFGGTNSNNMIYGIQGDDRIFGLDGDDTIIAQDGDDTVFGGNDEDEIFGGDGADTLFGDDGADIIRGGAGGDRQHGSGPFGVDGEIDRFITSHADLAGDTFASLDTGETKDVIEVTGVGTGVSLSGSYAEAIPAIGAPKLYTINLGINAGVDVSTFIVEDALRNGVSVTIENGTAFITFGGSTGADRLSALGGETVEGLEGNDVLRAAVLADGRLFGGAGDDELIGILGSDQLYGDSGNDRLTGDAGFDDLFGGLGDDTAFGGDDDDNVYGGNGNDTLHGDAGGDLIYGGIDTDTIYGGKGFDSLFGDEGQDEIFGGDDADEIYGGDGTDFLYGDDGDDYLEGGASQDFLSGGSGMNELVGGGDSDFLFAGSGIDTLYGGDITGAGDGVTDFFQGTVEDFDGDTLADFESGQLDALDLFGTRLDVSDIRGGFSANYSSYTLEIDSNKDGLPDASLSLDLNPGEGGFSFTRTGFDTVRLRFGGTGGDDLLYAAGTRDTIDALGGNDMLFGQAGVDQMFGNLGDDQLFGAEGDDLLYGGAGADLIEGGQGSDIIDVGAADGAVDIVRGNALDMDDRIEGFETGPLTARKDILRVEGHIGPDDVAGFYDEVQEKYALQFLPTRSVILNVFVFDQGLSFDYSTPGYTDIRFGANIEGHTLYGMDDADDTALSGSTADDTIMGRGGEDLIDGGSGNDMLYGGDQADILIGGAGTDALFGGAGDDILRDTDLGGTTFDGGDGSDVADFTARGFALTVNAALQAGFTSIEGVIGTRFDDTIISGLGDAWLEGGDGHDRLYARDFNDTIFGGAGDDTIKGRGGDDMIYGGDGDDILMPGDGADTVDGGAGIDRIDLMDMTEGADLDLLTGVITGRTSGDGGSVFNVEDAAGSNFDDIVRGNFGANDLHGRGGNDQIGGFDGDDYLTGGAGNDELFGGLGNDMIRGDSGEDRMVGERGDDQLISALDGETDIFAFGYDTSIQGGDGLDIITGFELGIDLIEIANVTFADLEIRDVTIGAYSGVGIEYTQSSTIAETLAMTNVTTGGILIVNQSASDFSDADFIFV